MWLLFRYNYKLSKIEDVCFKKTIEFCNKGMVRADPPPPPSYGQRPHFYIFLDPSLRAQKGFF